MTRSWLFALMLLAALPAAAGTPQTPATRLLAAAYGQVGVTVRYDPAYRVLAFPGGDVPIDRGVCTDVVIRAYRGIGIDLQSLVNRDMRAHFGAYPKLWGAAAPDPNIDHRRVPNLGAFFTRHGERLPVTAVAADYRPGDIVTWRLPQGLAHIGIVADRMDGETPLVIHNIGEGARVEDVLFAFTITGHYRYLPEKI